MNLLGTKSTNGPTKSFFFFVYHGTLRGFEKVLWVVEVLFKVRGTVETQVGAQTQSIENFNV